MKLLAQMIVTVGIIFTQHTKAMENQTTVPISTPATSDTPEQHNFANILGVSSLAVGGFNAGWQAGARMGERRYMDVLSQFVAGAFPLAVLGATMGYYRTALNDRVDQHPVIVLPMIPSLAGIIGYTARGITECCQQRLRQNHNK